MQDPYGMCTHFTRKWEQYDHSSMQEQIEMMKDIGVDNVRCDIDYGTMNDSNTGILDSVLLSCGKHKLNFLGIAYDSEFYTKKEWRGNNAFKAYLTTLLNHYAKKIKWVEFCNEIDLVKQANVTQHYLDDIQEFHKVKQKNKRLKILSTGYANVALPAFDSITADGAYKYFDVMNFHTYSVPEDIPVQLEIIHKSMEKYNWNKPVWLTECGMSTQIIKEGGNDERRNKEEEQARRVARIYLISFAYGVDKVFWYKFRSYEKDPTYSEDNYGIVHKDLSPKPAYYAYKTLVSMCPHGSSRPVLTITNGLYKAEWTRPDKKHAIALWHRIGSSLYDIDTKSYALYDYIGNVLKLQDQKLYVNTGVVYAISK